MQTSIALDTYAIINNVDDSILKLNPFLTGYQFEIIPFNELGKSFQNLFFRNIQSFPGQTKIGETIMDSEIFDSIWKGGLFPTKDIFRKQYVIFLKANEEGEKIIEGQIIRNHDCKNVLTRMLDFLYDFLLRIRLLKQGDVNFSSAFQIYKDESRFITMKFRRTLSPIEGRKMSIEDSDLEMFQEILHYDLRGKSLYEIAFNSFEVTYEFFDPRLRYIALMTCLENIFNISSHQIAHTISRHLAILISKDESEFERHYKRIKELYGHRNSLVHGSGKNISVLDGNELQDYVRLALMNVLKLKLDKKSLFNFLNSKGFSSPI